MAKHKDPICGMMVDDANPGATSEFEGRTYYFCRDGCRAKFEEDPARWARRAA